MWLKLTGYQLKIECDKMFYTSLMLREGKKLLLYGGKRKVIKVYHYIKSLNQIRRQKVEPAGGGDLYL